MSKRLLVIEDEEWVSLPHDIIPTIVDHFVGSIIELFHIHAIHSSIYKKWKDVLYLRGLLEKQKVSNEKQYVKTLHGQSLKNYFIYESARLSFFIISHILSNIPSLDRKCHLGTIYQFGSKLSRFFKCEYETVETGTKTYPQKSSPLSCDQRYILTMVYKYMKLVYGWVVGFTRNNANRKLNINDFSGVYLEHEFTICLVD
jgi:hypothetical protein